MQKAVFLDRDGVLNEVLNHRVKFVNRPEDLHLLEGVEQAIRQFNEDGWKVFIVTNQGGVGLGYMTEDELGEIHDRLVDLLEASGARVDDIAYCPHMPHEGCVCRKPEAGMILELAEAHNIFLGESYMVGDREPDIQAGRNAGTRTVFIANRKNKKIGADYHFKDLISFSNWLVNGKGM
ncbi:D-glycero-alpha-D-manno-heptose-1,7-bisphosphate 7-phosphatase [Salinicoccus bachuensis]|uniref:D,D-heptose 1,7-bisphosphate phosphatase n=1 Tax=Salinicoccus bachuensis TaxID=3136731 RepID=A0ABZ3CIS5_9STAP